MLVCSETSETWATVVSEPEKDEGNDQGGVRDKGFHGSACVRRCNRLFKGNQVQGAIKRSDSKPSEGRREIIQGFAKLRLGNGRRPCNRAVTRGSKQGKVQKSREIVNKALGIEDVKGKEKIYECVKVNSLSSMVEFLDSLENEVLVNNNKETFKVCFDNMLKWFCKKQLRLEEELDLPPNLDGYEIEMMHFYLIVKYMGGYEKVTKEEMWLDVVDRMGLLVYMSIGDNETDSRMEADYKDGLKTTGADLKGGGTDPKEADAEPDAAETSLKAEKIETNTAGALAHA
ncbi:hypothetical protein E3N88_27121 [Mikania micrantha]|uniref:ARID domain-containing protein n=1 Tax=Mikania micrantha TaxID=192012 RepID=A0A5N6MWY7_9ASTR|nr:hypothetical protein E3N88_27121 [Mikania micrantha]